MGELKSAYEKALERAGKLGRMSPEEMRARTLAECAAIGMALAERYMEHGYVRVLDEEMGKHGGQGEDAVAGAAVARLVEALSLADPRASERALRGIVALRPGADISEAQARYRSLESEYTAAREQACEQAEAELRSRGVDTLDRMGIAGSAIAATRTGVSDLRLDATQELQSRLEPRLEEVKKELLKLARGS